MDSDRGEHPHTRHEGITPAVVGYLILAIIIALILWRFVFSR